MWDTKGAGIYEHDCNDQLILSNIVGRSTGPGIYLRGKVSNRVVGGVPVKGGSHQVVGNWLIENKEPILAQGPPSQLEDNRDEDLAATFDPATWTLTWRDLAGKVLTRRFWPPAVEQPNATGGNE